MADSLRLAALQHTDDALLEDEDVIGAQLGVAAGDVEHRPAILEAIADSSWPSVKSLLTVVSLNCTFCHDPLR